MTNTHLLYSTLKEMRKDNFDLNTVNAGVIISIATSLAVIADHIKAEANKDED